MARYNGPANSEDVASAIALDSSGNSYVTGDSWGVDFDYGTVSYDSAGNQRWVARYNGSNLGDYARAIAVDSSGNSYVTGNSFGVSDDYVTVSYDSAGNRRWVARYNAPGNGYDIAEAIAVDSSGNTYVTGYSVGAGSSTDYATVSYDSAGNQRWVARYNGLANGSDFAEAIAVDFFGNSYVTGYSTGFSSGDYATVSYDPAGNQRWVARYAPGNGLDHAFAIAVDSSGNSYVTGLSWSWSGGNNDYATIRYSPGTHTPPESFIVTRGVLQSGGLAELLRSDDKWMVMQQRHPFSAVDPNVQLVVQATAPTRAPTSLRFRMEASCSGVPSSNVPQLIELYNYQTSQWEQVDQSPSHTSDWAVGVTVTTNPARFVQPLTGQMRARLSWFDRGVASLAWGSAIDQTIWIVAH
ncbi:MAG: SBBP repeat-containing protein [Fimbriimonadales bacterium]